MWSTKRQLKVFVIAQKVHDMILLESKYRKRFI